MNSYKMNKPTKTINMITCYVITPSRSFLMSFREDAGLDLDMMEVVIQNRIKEKGYPLTDGLYWCGSDVTNAPPEIQQWHTQNSITVDGFVLCLTQII